MILWRLRRENKSGYRSSVFFFFQAEDGIRDIGVTGVQTCALPICEAMCVDPERVGPGNLHVSERTRRRPFGDLGAPANGCAEESKPVAKDRAAAKPLGRFDDPKAEPAGRDCLEVPWIGEEGEDVRGRPLEDLPPLERELSGHGVRDTISPFR